MAVCQDRVDELNRIERRHKPVRVRHEGRVVQRHLPGGATAQAAGDREAAERKPVIAAHEGEDAVPFFNLPGDLQRRLDGVCSCGAAELDFVIKPSWLQDHI